MYGRKLSLRQQPARANRHAHDGVEVVLTRIVGEDEPREDLGDMRKRSGVNNRGVGVQRERIGRDVVDTRGE